MHALHGCCMTGGCKNYDSGDWEVGTIMIKRDGEREIDGEREKEKEREKREREKEREREKREREKREREREREVRDIAKEE